MLLIGIDDTDTLDHPGTNKLARHLLASLDTGAGPITITRHQLLVDPRVPCTKKNGCAAIRVGGGVNTPREELAARLATVMRAWCPPQSDPGLCLASEVPAEVRAFGIRCQRELVTQREARELADRHGLLLWGLGGTEDGVIGALAAVGLAATGNDGRVVHCGARDEDHFDLTGPQPIDALLARGVEVRRVETGEPVTAGLVELGKRLRPNYRDGRVVLYVAPLAAPHAHWEAVRQV